MHQNQSTYRTLCEAVWAYDGPSLFDDLLAPWLDTAQAEIAWLCDLTPVLASLPSKLPREDLWRLYALTRLLDVIRLGMAPLATPHTIEPEEYTRFAEALSLTAVEPSSYHPFWHEVVAIEVAVSQSAMPRLVRTQWATLMLGPLLISRGGATVNAGSDVMNPDVALKSTLYWAYVRNGRSTRDLGSDWGSNSQWRTEHRLDYATQTEFHFNKGGTGETFDETPLIDALELLRYRCCLTSRRYDGPDFPHALTYVESRLASPA
ncbi:MAG: hypothetical protein HKN27_10100 [Silicimonas sp.]|nr:hypothetical protein [Silicimonas sp.]